MSSDAFAGRSVLIAGAASGIGQECARQFARLGARVALADLNHGLAAGISADINAAGMTSIAIPLDIRDEASVVAAIGEAEDRLGTPDLVVNSAGVAQGSSFLDTSLAALQTMLAVNLDGAFLIARQAARRMIAAGRGGAIVQLASVSGKRGNAGRGAYGPTKAGVIALTQVMAIEFAQYGIRVNAVAPGPIETPLAQVAHTSVMRQNWERSVPAGHYGQPRDVAAAVLFLASARASAITGHTLDVDGGFVAGGLLQM